MDNKEFSQERLESEVSSRETLENSEFNPTATLKYFNDRRSEFYYLIENLNISGVSPQLAESLATQFLQGMNRVNAILLDVSNHLILFEKVRDVELSLAGAASGEKSVAAQERAAVLMPKYQFAESCYQQIKNLKEYYSNVYTMFDRGHVMYKNLALDKK